MDLVRHLEYFVTVAEERHFGRAAATLGVTQPPVSRAIKQLEKHLGLTLIERTPDGAAITEQGAALLPRARLIVEDSRRLTTDAFAMTDAGTVRLGVTPQLDDATTARIAAALGRGSDGAVVTSVRVTTAGSLSLLDSLRTGGLDVAVVDHPAVIDSFEASPIVTLRRLVAVPSGHPAATSNRPRVSMLADLDFACSPRSANPPAHDLLVDAFRRRGLDPRIVDAASHRDVVAAVASGSCFGLVPESVPPCPGTEHVALARQDVALRVRTVHAGNSSARTVDRILLQACR